VARTIVATVDAIGDERLRWLRALPGRWSGSDLTVVHASPDDFWRSPPADAADDDLASTYGPLGTRRVVYGHIHRPFVRQLPSFTLVNSGSVGLPYDGDPRAAYVILDDERITIRRVEYDVEREVKTVFERHCPDAAWIADMLRTGTPVAPPE
jgi:diadenosine tetraphosphatase ApaH/serine/threonine PP2A family protein phosphatase